MKYVKVEAEISARAYKQLCARLKKYNKSQLWEALDHYIFHCMNDAQVAELMQHLDENEKHPVQVAASTEDAYVFEAEEDDTDRPSFAFAATPEFLEAQKAQLPLIFDETFFDYIDAADVRRAGEVLCAFAKTNQLPVEPHWQTAAESGAFSRVEARAAK